ncbi:unnamed protein product [Heligmosomoides polygyrus]|uniref:Uncharacterized protein n=1 Tax=Heligmosomoides polygyrus TaxID=6339 RepID=A0A183G4E3_HELPZ|nr:unnamed protein product [Heligmosomoides polygyrus]
MDGPIPYGMQEDVRNAIGRMKLRKAAGPVGVSMEVWKVPGDCGVNWPTQFSIRVSREGEMQNDWMDNIIVPVFKQKGDAFECSNYRGIKPTSHTMKMYKQQVDSRLREMAIISQEQWGFMPLRGPPQTLPSSLPTEKYEEKGKPEHLTTLAQEKTYDRLPRGYIKGRF